MAMYHFRLKSDKKPDGTRVATVKHVEYIRREGKFAEQEHWLAKTKFVGNVITTAEKTNALDGQTVLLYKTDDFGSIRNSENGIEVSEQASPTTISIALMLAYESLNHQPLIIHGSPEFKKSVLKAAIFDELEVSFADHLLQNEFIRQLEEKEAARKQFVANGGRVVTKRFKPQPIEGRPQTIDTITRNGLQLPTLSQLRTLPAESEELEQLPDEEIRKLDDISKDICGNVSWNFSAERKNYAQWTAAKILERVEETLDNVYASSHVEYINRERAFANRGGCIFHAHRLPSWAHDDPKIFFKLLTNTRGLETAVP